MITKVEGKCQFEYCEKDAARIACGRDKHLKPGCFCEEHACIVEEEHSPEYLVSCPNCFCHFGVG